MSVEKKQCQNEETVDECSARLLQERAEEECECVPWSLKMTKSTFLNGTRDTFERSDEEHRPLPVCDPHGSRCYADSIAYNRGLVKSECSVKCRGLYIDVEHIEDAESSMVPLEDDGLAEDTHQLMKEYSVYRHGDISNYLSNLESLLQDTQGWPFNTRQTKRKSVFLWDCPGPEQPKLPEECKSLDEKDRYDRRFALLFVFCDKQKIAVGMREDNCTTLPEDEDLAEICEQKMPLWKVLYIKIGQKYYSLFTILWKVLIVQDKYTIDYSLFCGRRLRSVRESFQGR